MVVVVLVGRDPGRGRPWAAVATKAFMDSVPDVPDRRRLMVVNQAPGMTFEDRTGKVIATRGPKHGSPVTLDELPAYVPQAFLAAEDRRFYQHGPVDLQGIARARLGQLARRPHRPGRLDPDPAAGRAPCS